MEAIPIVEYWGAQAANERARDYILTTLEVRLHPDVAVTFKPALESIENAQQLKALFDASLRINSVEEFQHLLDATNNGAGNGAAGQS